MVEDKPEVKKAGGVYYTPTYIVDYIVKHTVGKLLEGKTPKQAAEAAHPRPGLRLRLLPHRRLPVPARLAPRLVFATPDPEKWATGKNPTIVPFPSGGRARVGVGLGGGTGNWRLTTAERKRMLDLHKKLPAARTDQEKTALQRQIADTDKRIDRLVYDLYGLTEEEIKIVEGTA